MSMSTFVKGLVDDEYHAKMVKAYEACGEAGTDIPVKLDEYFDSIDMDGHEAVAEDGKKLVELPTRKWADEVGEGFELDVADIPENVKTIRFWNSW